MINFKDSKFLREELAFPRVLYNDWEWILQASLERESNGKAMWEKREKGNASVCLKKGTS